MTWWGAAVEAAGAGGAGTLTPVLWGIELAWFAVCAVVLVRTDLREHRLPNRWTLRLAVGGLAGMAGGAATAGRWDLVASCLLGGLGYGLALALLHVLSRGGLGLGDVKLAVGLGLHTGVAGPGATLAAGVGAVLIGGVSAAALILLRRATRRTALPFGPPMVLAAVVVLLTA